MRVILCHGVRDLKKQHYDSHASDPMPRSKRSEETTLRVTCEWQTSRNLLRSCLSFGLTDMKILSDRKIFCRSEKKVPKKFTVTCIMFSLAFLEWFTLVLAIGQLISPLVFIEVKVIQFSVFSVVQNCICYVFYSVCLEFCCFDDLVL
jgi:hypothetical protein